MKQISDIFGLFPTEVISLIRGSIHSNDILSGINFLKFIKTIIHGIIGGGLRLLS